MVRLSGSYFCACQSASLVFPGRRAAASPSVPLTAALNVTGEEPGRAFRLFISETVSGFTASDLSVHFG